MRQLGDSDRRRPSDGWGRDAGEGMPPPPIETHVFGGTFAPAWALSCFYGPLADRLARGGPVQFHAMTPLGGVGRTDKIVESHAPICERARSTGIRLRLAGHSLGGVVAWALAHEYADTVDCVEVWGAPLRGTSMARFFHNVAAEARFLNPASRWLKRYDAPLNGPVVRSMYSAVDALVVPARQACYVEGDRAENHLLSPFPVPRRVRRPGERIHSGWSDHLLLPRHAALLAA